MPDSQPTKPAPAAAQGKKPDILSVLPFGGKWAFYMLALSLLLVYAIVALSHIDTHLCDLDIPQWRCAAAPDDGAGVLPKAKLAMLAIAGGLSLWLAASFAVFVYRWAKGLPIHGILALKLLVFIGGGEMVIIDIWQGYAGSAADKITNYIYGVLILWIAVAWHGMRIKAWLEEAVKKAMQAPVDAAKEAVGGAMQTIKSTAEESVDKITEGLGKTTEAVKGTADTIADSAKSLWGRTSSAVGDGVDYVGDKATAAGQAIAKAPGQVASAVKDGATAAVSKAGDGVDYVGDKATSAGQAIVKAPGQVASVVKDGAGVVSEGASNLAGKVFSRDNKQAGDALPDKTEEGKGASGDDADKQESSRDNKQTDKDAPAGKAEVSNGAADANEKKLSGWQRILPWRWFKKSRQNGNDCKGGGG